MNVRDLVTWGRNRLPTAEGPHPFFALQRDINKLFDDMWGGFELPTMMRGRAFPSIEVRDEDKQVRVIAELPGMDENDVELTLADGVLTLKGEKKSETTEKTAEGGSVSERWYGRFERAVEVGAVEEDKVAAEYKNGVLTVTLPKAETAKDKARKIPITH
jgi:HSP20 family protein